MKKKFVLLVSITFLVMCGGCSPRLKQCASSRKYHPGFRLEVRVPDSSSTTAVQVITVPADGIVVVEIPSNKDCKGIVLTPLPEAPQPQ